MSTSNSETGTASVPESPSKPIAEPIYTYAISWGWLLAGLICVFGFGGVAGAVYYIQTQDLPRRLVEVANNMMEESEQAKAEVELTEDTFEKGQLMRKSLQLRGDAANLLDRYRRSNPGDTNVAILEKLYDILESLYRDYGESSTAVGSQRGEQLISLSSDILLTVDVAGSIKYRKRLLELEWDRPNLTGIINRGKELLNVSVPRGDGYYEAMRYIAMALFDYLPLQPYDTNEHQLPPAFKETMDELLESLNSERPEDIEIAKRYAEFLVRVNRVGDRNFTESASGQLRLKSEADRLALARNRIDEIVLRNPTDPAAYLARYHFISQFSPSGLDLSNSDLQKVLELAPNSNEGLILSALHSLRNAGIAAQEGEQDRALQWQNTAEEYFRRTVKENPGDPLGYQYLGEFLLLVKRDHIETISVWNAGLQNAGNRGSNEELVGRLVMLLLQQGRVDEARTRLNELARSIAEMRIIRSHTEIRRIRDIENLLYARLFHTESNQALANIEAALRENRVGDAQQWYGRVQSKRSDAVQRFELVLLDFGKNDEDYIIERRSVYYTLVPQSLLQLAQLKLDSGEPDKAADYFNRARRFRDVLKPALIGLSIALQQNNQLEQAARVLGEASANFPDDLSIQYTHAMVSFRAQVTSNAATTESLGHVQSQLEALESSRSDLPQPWILDIRLIHLEFVRANLSNNADTIVEAMNTATRKFRALESQSFPPDAEGNVRNYIEDPAFVAELAGIYSSLASRSDFDRLLTILRAFPDGEDAYYEARINDANRRGSRNEVIEIIDEAIESPLLSQTRKEQFVALLQNLRGEGMDSAAQLDRAYEQLKTTFDENPESLKPQAFFMLARLALDRGELTYAKQVRDRLVRIEGQGGTHWRWIDIRLMLAEDDPDYDEMRRIQEVIARLREDWSEAYIISAMIEEKYYTLNPGNTVVRDNLIVAYQNAISRGSLQPDIWQRLIDLLQDAGRTEEVRNTQRNAALRGVALGRADQLPQPYGKMYSDVQKAIADEDPIEADRTARQCILLAEVRGVSSELIHILHLTLGQVFLDADMFESAFRHLSITARRGGRFVYPLALCTAREGIAKNDASKVDVAFTILMDEITLSPSSVPQLLPAVLVLLAQVQPLIQPSEAVYARLDRLMERVENGERLPLRGTTLESSDSDTYIPVGTEWVNPRSVRSVIVRFPERTDNLDPSTIQFLAPTESVDEESVEGEDE